MSAEVSLVVRREDASGVGVWLGMGDGSGGIVLSTIEAKVSLGGDQSRLAGFAGALE